MATALGSEQFCERQRGLWQLYRHQPVRHGALPNSRSGIYIAAPENVIAGNLVSGNIGRGIFVNNDAIGASVGDAIPAGSIPVDPGNNVIAGNIIGLSIVGSVAVPNTEGGIELVGASDTTIGGTGGSPGAVGNYIAGNGGPGLLITGGSQGNQVFGNHIGVGYSAQGDATPNTGDGVLISDSPGNTIGGPDLSRNIISDNSGHGVHITGATSAANTIVNNYIGQSSSGLPHLGNVGNGIQIDGAPGTMIGGPSLGLSNVISGNLRGISVSGQTAVDT